MAPGLRETLHLRRLFATMQGFARVHLLRTGVRLGLFEALRTPQRDGELASRLGLAPDLVTSWLRAAEAQSLLERRDEHYALVPFTRWLLDAPDAASLHAMLEQVTAMWHPSFDSLPRLMKGAERPAFGTPEEAARTAEASRIVEARALDALARVPGAKHAQRVLDVGCGHGSYLAGFLARHRDAHGVGVELDAAVAEEARRRLREAEVSRRAEIRAGDFMVLDLPAGSFDLAMLNNNVYYFAPADRPALWRRVVSRLAPGGVVAIQAPVHTSGRLARLFGAAAASATFDLLLRTHRNLYGVPDLETLHAELLDAGCAETGEVSIVPGGGQRYVWGKVAS
jgi:trans-aconitate methyltransferase